jgi:hypothetical protein
MTPLESSASGATIWSITLELSIAILEASFTHIYDVYSKASPYGKAPELHKKISDYTENFCEEQTL